MIRNFKLSAMALALMACAGAHADDVTIYGTVDAGLRAATNQATANATLANPDSGTKYSLISGGLLSSRLGFKGSEDLGQGLKAVFQLESGLNLNNGSNDASGILFNRIAHVGLTDGHSSIFLGRDYNEAYMSLSEVDPLNFRATPLNVNIQSSSLNDTTAFGVLLAGQTNARSNNAITYEGNYGAFKGGLQVSSGGLADSSASNSYGARASYDFGPALLAGSVSRLNDASNNHLDVYTVGGKYLYTPNLTLAATYTDQQVYGGVNNGYTRRISSAGAYYNPSALTYGVAYYGTRASNVGGVAGVDGAQDKLVGLVSYGFSKRTNLYTTADYARSYDALVAPLTNKSNVFGLTVGVNHSF
jgi:predicted porin